MKLSRIGSMMLPVISLPLALLPLTATAQDTATDQADLNVIVIDRVQQSEVDADMEIAGAEEDVLEAVTVVQEMQQDADLRQVLDEAKGVFVIPDYAIAALVVGASGGEGVLLARVNNEWSNPAFYDIGGLSAGFQAGAAAGDVAMILMSEDAVNSFVGDNDFALNADAGFSIVDWSARARGQVGRGEDIIVWTDTEGLLAEISIGATNINYDEEETEEYYGQPAEAQEILAGDVVNPHADYLQQALRQQ